MRLLLTETSTHEPDYKRRVEILEIETLSELVNLLNHQWFKDTDMAWDNYELIIRRVDKYDTLPDGVPTEDIKFVVEIYNDWRE